MKNLLTNAKIVDYWYVSLLRFINKVILVVYLFSVVSYSFIRSELSIKGYNLILLFIIPPLVYAVLFFFIMDGIEFYEWDKKERRKKKMYSSIISTNIIFFLYLTVWHFCTLNWDSSKLVFWIQLFYAFVFAFNACFSYYITYNMLSNYLSIDNFVAKKPDNWDSELTEEEEMLYRIHNR